MILCLVKCKILKTSEQEVTDGACKEYEALTVFLFAFTHCTCFIYKCFSRFHLLLFHTHLAALIYM